MPKASSGDPNPMRSAERMLQVLRSFRSDASRRTLNEVAQELALAPTTVRRLLETLERNRFLTFEPESSRYALGLELVRLGGVALGAIDLVRDARPVLGRLERETGEAVQLTVLDGAYAVVIDFRPGRNVFRYFHGAGHRYLSYAGSASGKVLLADLDGDALNQTLASSAPPRELEIVLDQVRKQGFAINDRETQPDVWAIAAPVRNHTGRVVAAVNVPCLVSRLDTQGKRRVTDLVCAAAGEISKALLHPAQ
ncbi:IclR family transcriptional regulator [Bradyrhizobium ottawaense]|uniref:IclR family transcriptional regulator n=1 Tax=Bradyrhizobium ottawaense TaxID=931866 RepID=UPI003835423F